MEHRTDHADIDHVVAEVVDNKGIFWAQTSRLNVPTNLRISCALFSSKKHWVLTTLPWYVSYFRFLLSVDDPLPVLCANSTFQRQPNCLQVKPGKNSKLLFRTPHSTVVRYFDLIQFLSHIFFASNDIFYPFNLDSNDDLKCFHIFFRSLGRHCFHSGSGIW